MDEQENNFQTVEVTKKNNLSKKYIILLAIIAIFFFLGAVLFAGAILLSSKVIVEKLDSIDKKISGNYQAPAEQLGPVNISIADEVPFLGSKDAKVTIVEFADYQCPFCGIFFKESFPKLKTEYIDTGKVKFYYQDFAFLGDESSFAAEAAKCSGQQGKYWEYHDYLYQNQNGENEGAFSQLNLKKFGKTIGVDEQKFNNCVDSRVFKPDVEAETKAGQDYGVNATPTVFINGIKYEGAQDFARYKEAIEKALAE